MARPLGSKNKKYKHGVPYANTEIYRDVLRKCRVEYRRKIRVAVVEFLGGRCVKCGFEDIRALQIDHVNGGGRQERKVLFSNVPEKFYRHVMTSNSGEYQLLCANCNVIKRVTNKEN